MFLLPGCNSNKEKQKSSGSIKLSPVIISSQNQNSAKNKPDSVKDDPETVESDSTDESEEFTEEAQTAEEQESQPESRSETPGKASGDDIADSEPDKQWKEWEYHAELFTIARVNAKSEPLDKAHAVRMYRKDTPVSVVAITDTNYYKLDNGDYISANHLYRKEDSAPETVKTVLSYDPPSKTNGRISYDPKKALDYAKEHWQETGSLCAGFGSECLTAGGLDYNETSSTKLFNKLIDAHLGYAVAVDLNDDGTANVPDYVYPGDIIFYYCAEENMMVHTAIYNGNTKDGIMKAYAHNPADNGETPFKYYDLCVGGCDAVLNKIVVFCFYRDKNSITFPTIRSLKSGSSDSLRRFHGIRISFTAAVS